MSITKSLFLEKGWGLALHLSLALFLVCLLAPSRCLGSADVAVYTDTAFPGGGAWAEGIQAIEAMLTSYGYTYEEIGPAQINAMTDLHARYKVVIFGGGWAGGYNRYLNESGFQNIRAFVRRGGGFFGICAGAYLAADAVLWKPDVQTPAELYNYSLDLFRGLATGVLLRIKPWTAPTGCQAVITEGAAMTGIQVNTSALPFASAELELLYYGGPALLPFLNANQSVQVVAGYQIPGSPMDGQPAMILFPHGNGKVFLSGPHPEVSFDRKSCSLYFNYQAWQLMNEALSLLMMD